MRVLPTVPAGNNGRFPWHLCSAQLFKLHALHGRPRGETLSGLPVVVRFVNPVAVCHPFDDDVGGSSLTDHGSYTMHDAYIPTTFLRHDRPLRGVMIDNQPWFSTYDFARLLGLHHPQALHRRLKPHETRRIRLHRRCGSEETIDVMNEAGLYKALIRFGHPECQQLDEWLTREVIPTLRDQQDAHTHAPRRVWIGWQSERLLLLEWQGELWMQWEKVPRYLGL